MRDKEKNKTIVIFFSIITWQTSRANVMASLKTLLVNKLPRSESTGVSGFIFPQNGNLQCQKAVRRFPWMPYFVLLALFFF